MTLQDFRSNSEAIIHLENPTAHWTFQMSVGTVLMRIEIRLFLLIDALSRFSGTAITCSAGLFLQLAKQLLDSTAAASGRGRASVGAGVATGPWRRLEKSPLTPKSRASSSPPTHGPGDVLPGPSFGALWRHGEASSK
ncbi:MAG: hypothetical protein ACP5P4_01720 [Steroidobacteraceae bacterium]